MLKTALILWLLYNASAPKLLIGFGWLVFIVEALDWAIHHLH